MKTFMFIKKLFAFSIFIFCFPLSAFASNSDSIDVSFLGRPHALIPVHCNITNAKKTDDVHGGTHRILVRGFNPDGKVDLKVADVNKYYFSTKRDPKYLTGPRTVTFTVTNNQNANVMCYEGRADRPIRPGGWGATGPAK